jgi:glutaconate CoA-transferase subunit A
MGKVCALQDAISSIEDGTAVAMGCGLESLITFAASHEIIRQKKRDLMIIAPISDLQFDQLIAAPWKKAFRDRSK